MREWLATFFSHPVVLLAIVAGIVRAIYWVASVNKDLSTFGQKMSEISDLLTEIRQDIKKIFAKIGEPMVAGKSPVSLTKLGKEVAQAMGAEGWAKEIAPSLKERVEGKEPYQIEQIAREYVGSELSEEWTAKVAQEAFQRGSRKDDVKSVLWVLLRDELLRLTGQTVED